MGDEIQITVIATGFKGNAPQDAAEQENPFDSFLSRFGNGGNVNRGGATASPSSAAPSSRPVEKVPSSTNLFSKFGEDDGIDVPVFLRNRNNNK